MFRLLLIVIVALDSCLAHDECKKLGWIHHGIRCCKKLVASLEDNDAHKECLSVMKPPPNCDADICYAKKRGYAGSEDGKFDKKDLESTINKVFESNPELAEEIIKECVNGDLIDFGPPDFCDLTKARHCIQMHTLMNCLEWETDGSCIESQELAKKCLSQHKQ